MAQKVHPIGFRIGATQLYDSTWFARHNFCVQHLRRDHKIRQIWESFLSIQSGKVCLDLRTEITDLNIQHRLNLIQITIYTGSPKFLLRNDKIFFRRFKEDLRSSDSSVNYRFRLVKNRTAAISAVIIAKGLGYKIEKRTFYRRAIKQATRLLKKARVPGYRVQVAGRLRGVEIARYYWVGHGRLPLQTLAAEIDYSLQEAHTKYGVVGIKVWIFTGKFFETKFV